MQILYKLFCKLLLSLSWICLENKKRCDISNPVPQVWWHFLCPTKNQPSKMKSCDWWLFDGAFFLHVLPHPWQTKEAPKSKLSITDDFSIGISTGPAHFQPIKRKWKGCFVLFLCWRGKAKWKPPLLLFFCCCWRKQQQPF